MRRRVLFLSWLALFTLIAVGLLRLRFDAEIFNLLPSDVPAVAGLKLYQQHFTNARELIITVRSPDAGTTEAAAAAIAKTLSQPGAGVSSVVWQPPWLEHPDQSAELIGYLWLNQPPDIFGQLTNRLSTTNLPALLASVREQLATSMSPGDIAQLSYDPFGLTRLPEDVTSAAPAFGQGQEMFASTDGTFRIIFVQADHDLTTYRECRAWLDNITARVANSRSAAVPAAARPPVETRSENSNTPVARDAAAAGTAALRPIGPAAFDNVIIGYTGRPAFVAEISRSMERDMTISVLGTSVIIAILFWIAHRRLKPMLWLLTLLALILAGTLALGGLIFGAINVVSMGFAAILLGLAVDYAVVHYQEALAHPNLSIPEIRRAIAPSIFWAAITTIFAFLVLNFGGLPGLAQLGTLVGVGVALAALVMIFAYLPPLFPDRRTDVAPVSISKNSIQIETSKAAVQKNIAIETGATPVLRCFAATAALIPLSIAVLLFGFPKMDATANALRPRRSAAYAAMDEIKRELSQQREPLWLLVSGTNETEVANRLVAVESALNNAVSRKTISGFTLPTAIWPRPENQIANRSTAQFLAGESETLRAAALANGFTQNSMALTGGILDTWTRAAATTTTFWPTKAMSRWIFEKVVARGATNFFALGLLYPNVSSSVLGIAELQAQLDAANVQSTAPNRRSAIGNRQSIWLSGWELLGEAILSSVRSNLWKLVLPIAALVLLSLWLAFRRLTEVMLSAGILLMSGLCLLAVMRLAGWSWNLLNLMALPLILGTGVDYSIFMQLALRRHHGDLQIAHRSVGRALLLCGGTAISGFAALGFSNNAGMASLGQVCAVGIAANVLISVYLLPVWWKKLVEESGKRKAESGKLPEATDHASRITHHETHNTATKKQLAVPSSLYRQEFWLLGIGIVRLVPRHVCVAIAKFCAGIYWRLGLRRREIVIQNLMPAVNDDRAVATVKARELFQQFAVKVIDLWRYEAGLPIENSFGTARGWEHFAEALAGKRGVLLLTPHLGNWEFGGPWLTQKGVRLLVVTLAEPGQKFTQMRQASRARWNIETLVIGTDPFASLEIIKRLQAGATVALLVDRPTPSTEVIVELFGQPFPASIAAAELARASGCVLLPVFIPREGDSYGAFVMPPIPYDRASLRDREARARLTQEILRAFEPAIRQHLDEWYHFIPIWKR